MKFPVTREYLQTVTLKELEEVEKEEGIQIKLNEYLRCLCNEFKRYLPQNLEKKEFIWIGLHLIPSSPDEKYLQQFIAKVKEQFIDCDVKIDPGRRYVIINWSSF